MGCAGLNEEQIAAHGCYILSENRVSALGREAHFFSGATSIIDSEQFISQLLGLQVLHALSFSSIDSWLLLTLSSPRLIKLLLIFHCSEVDEPEPENQPMEDQLLEEVADHPAEPGTVQVQDVQETDFHARRIIQQISNVPRGNDLSSECEL